MRPSVAYDGESNMFQHLVRLGAAALCITLFACSPAPAPTPETPAAPAADYTIKPEEKTALDAYKAAFRA